MMIDGQEWMDWLHKTRQEAEKERKRQGLSYAQRLARAEQVADAVRKELADQDAIVVREGKNDE